MKEEFNWYFNPTKEEIDEIWTNGILTVDANVLLDLYRYHESTRNALISSLHMFKNRLWISFQAAEEFFRNRSKVILSSEKTFKQAIEEIDKLQGNLDSTVNQLKGSRILPENVAEKLLNTLSPTIEEAKKQIIEVQEKYPNFLREDPILSELSELFKGSVGKDLDGDEKTIALTNAEDRKKNQIPPGYLDKDKEGERPYGDYLLWLQILNHTSKSQKPLIFVTSERKDDWWEKINGKTIGPRPELLKESYTVTKNRVLIYQTDRFLEYASKRSGKPLDTSTYDEIRAIDSLRTEAEHAVELVDQIIHNSTETHSEGILILNLKRPVRNMTASGTIVPYMENTPKIEFSLLESPSGLPKIKLRSGAGTNYDFHLHIISIEPGSVLPVGKYKLKYSATCEHPDAIQNGNNADEN